MGSLNHSFKICLFVVAQETINEIKLSHAKNNGYQKESKKTNKQTNKQTKKYIRHKYINKDINFTVIYEARIKVFSDNLCGRKCNRLICKAVKTTNQAKFGAVFRIKTHIRLHQPHTKIFRRN